MYRQLQTPLFWFTTLWLIGCTGPQEGPPFEPQDALQTFEIHQDFKLELFAAEPMVQDPVAMEIDEEGRIYVVEMPGYPLQTEPTGRIRLLLDQDGDGRPDQSKVFADGLVFPSGVMRWKQGILVTAAPDVLYLEDSDGDGRADIRRTILTGFARNNPQHTVNAPIYGLDNWIYLAHEGSGRPVIYKEKFGDPGSPIHFVDSPDGASIERTRYAIRFHPGRKLLEPLSSRTQFGHTFDEWGHYFTHDNANHARHGVISSRYLDARSQLLLGRAEQDVSDHGNAAQVYPITHRPRFELLTEAGEFTSACNLVRYGGGAFGPQYENLSLVAEPVHNLVHADLWFDKGSSFEARRLLQNREFLASRDSWFRPVFFYTGPDGAVYLLDYYREMIEHPEWSASRYHEDSEELYRGTSRGRIYRISAKEAQPAPAPHLANSGARDLVDLLAHPNIWYRRTAQRLLVDRADSASLPPLQNLADSSPSPLGRLHALWTLQGLDALDDGLILRGLRDPHPGVRENALILSEPFLSESPPLQKAVLELVGDTDPHVRLQVLLTLGTLSSPAAREGRQRLLLQGIEDPWVQMAALASAGDAVLPIFELALDRLAGRETASRTTLFSRLGALVGARQKRAETAALLGRVESARGEDWWRAAVLEGLARGLRVSGARTPLDGSAGKRLLAILETGSDSMGQAALRLLQLSGLPEGGATRLALGRAVARSRDVDAPVRQRANALQLLEMSADRRYASHFRSFLGPQHPDAVRIAAIAGMAAHADTETWRTLIESWRNFTPAVRDVAADALLDNPGGPRVLLDALLAGDVQPWSLTFWQKRDLLMSRDEAIRSESRRLLETPEADRKVVLDRYEAALDLEGDSQRGHQVFLRACAKCHRAGGEGATVGPDLATVRSRPEPLLLRDILLPSESIAQEYESYVIERQAGGFEEGVLKEQTAEAIVLLQEEEKEVMVTRDQIRRFYVSNVSAMPGDMENQITVSEMADLLLFIKQAPR